MVILTRECKKIRVINSRCAICVATLKFEMNYLKKNRLEVAEKKEIMCSNLENNETAAKNTKNIFFKDFLRRLRGVI